MRFAQLVTTALAATALLASPAAATKSSRTDAPPPRYPREQGGKGKRCRDPDASILDLVFCASGDEGFDRRRKDFDILRELIVAAELVDAVAGLEDVTVYAPTDKAFEKLAEDLGYDEKADYDEEAIFGYLAGVLTGLAEELEITLVDVLQFIILYHVGTEEYKFKDLRKGQTVETLSGDLTFESRKNRRGGMRVILEDNEPDVDDPRVHDRYRDLKTSQGIFHYITRVLIPLDLP